MLRFRFWILPLALFLALFALPSAPGEAGKLSQDGRAGMVLEVQGTALVQPAGRERWSPLGPKSVLYPGDLLRTSARGAHALEFRTTTGTVLLGPGCELQIQKDGLRLMRGELEASGRDGKALTVRAPGYEQAIQGTAWLRTEARKTRSLEKAPRWVEGYRNSASDEWMGSLLAKVDGRDVPLAVGYHKVGVEVRDQIARTTVEQSFINSTKSRLEGVFYFPLPADASISGFGMWIGGELVEADIVERQRARQIYEDILRRKKDPGLLEWEGGNIFKARVFPIEAHSEKRIRIRYTQVLPLEGDTWRYRYALRSELLRSKPLRELAIKVSVVSTQPMREIGSPTHEITLHNTGTEATAEFRASEYSPKDDFELAVKVDRARDVTAVPHRRGDDGYFMLLIAPPDQAAGAWKRDLIPEGDPLHLILVADTSGSMDEAARKNQADFFGALLELMGPKDRFRMLACDATAEWLTADAQPASSADAALGALGKRRSLGWTDLDLALRTAMQGAPDGALIVYVGDGVSTTGSADPNEQAERIRAVGRDAKVSVHAVAASSSYEASVLNAMATIGGGSVRTLESQPALDAAALLVEAARPTVRSMRVEIDGLRTARVYPAELPNLPLGSQQVVLGRFLPTGKPQQGTVTVSGMLQGKPVRYTADLSIGAGDNDSGNSFLPRLWGRRHIDRLLASGSSTQTQAEIVSFSERFGIMTPYTSFLVLESDEDRERYGVERVVRMRDGERFFAEAKDKAALEKKRDLMRAAGRWRVGLRGTMLREIARLGRDLPIAQPPELKLESFEVALAEPLAFSYSQDFDVDGNGDGIVRNAYSRSAGRDRGLSIERELLSETAAGADGGGTWGDPSEAVEMLRSEARLGAAAPAGAMPPPAASPTTPSSRMAPKRARRSADKKMEAPAEEAAPADSLDDDLEELEEEVYAEAKSNRPTGGYAGRGGRRQALLGGGERLRKSLSYGSRAWQTPQFTLQNLGFPWVPKPPVEDTGGAGTPWNEEVVTLLRALPRRDAVRNLEGAVHIVTTNSVLHPTRQTERGRGLVQAWIGAQGWRIQEHSETGFSEPYERWVHGGVRGAHALARQLARTRKATEADANAFWLPLWDMRSRDVIRVWQRAGWRARIDSNAGGTAVVRLLRAVPDRRAMVLTIDTSKNLIRETRHIDAQGRTSARVVRTDPIEVAGRWWAQDIRRFDHKDRMTSRRSVKVYALPKGALDVVAEQDALRLHASIVVHGPLPKAHEAKQALHEKRAKFVDHLIMALKFGQEQRWDPSLAAWTAAESLLSGKFGTRWVRTEFVGRARRGEAFKTWLHGLVPGVLAMGGRHGRVLAHYLYGKSTSVLGPTERLALLDRLAAAWKDGETQGQRTLLLQLHRANNLDAAKRSREARAVRQALAERWPHRSDLQLRHENDLENTGRFDAALAHLEDLLAEREPWLESERDAIYARLTERLWQRRLLQRLHAAVERWLGRKPEQPSSWQRWYSSFYFLGDTEGGDKAVHEALALRPKDGDHESVWARQLAAVQLALGSGWNFNLQTIEERWLADLEGLALYLTRLDADHATAAYTIFGNWRFRRTDAYRRVRQALYADLAKEGAVEGMPLPRLARYIGWLAWGRNQADDTLWQGVLDRLKTRWAGSETESARVAVGGHVLKLLDARGLREDAIAFARERLVHATKSKSEQRPQRARELFERLLGTPDRDENATQAREDECFELLASRVDTKESEEARRADMARTVRRLADRIYRWRYEAGIGSPEARKDKTRAELKVLRREVRKVVRAAVAERFLRAEQAGLDIAKPWFAVERLGYAAEHGEHPAAVIAETAKLLAASTERADRPLQRLYRERLAVILTYAATRKNVPADRLADVLELFRKGDVAEMAAREADPEVIALLDWRYQIYRLLVARDDVPTLAGALDDWIVPAKVDSRWRIARGYIHAETGDLAAATTQFEAVQKLDELGPDDYRVMADWYLVLNDDVRRGKALDRYYGHQNEWQLSNLAWNMTNQRRSRAGGVPGDFNPEVLRVLRALFKKAQWPGNYWWRQRDVYNATKDFRILATCAEALTGHTKEGTYGYLARVTQLMGGVHEEATLDELQRYLQARLEVADKPLDRRALRLGISLAAGRASQVKEQDPAHGRRALAALQAAFQEAWQTGERRQMATFLQGLGRVRDPAVKIEQLRQLEALRVATPADSDQRLHISDALAQTHWAYGDHDRALAVLGAALADARKANGGRVPMDVVRIFDRYVNWLANRKRFADAERYILTELERWALPMRQRGLRSLLYRQYVEALRWGGSVSIGRGEALFVRAAQLMEQSMLADPANAGLFLSTYCDLHTKAKKVRAPADAGGRLLRYAQERLPTLLARVPINGTGYVTTVAGSLRGLEGPRTGLAFLLDRHDSEPRWLARIGYDVWHRALYNFARWRREAGASGDLEPRLLKIVLAQLEHNLKLGGNHASYFWNLRNKWAWPEKADDFATTAEKMAELNERHLAIIQRCAHLLRHSLRRLPAGIAVLEAAHARGVLDLSARWTLASWLVDARRFSDALPVVSALVKEKPDNLSYRMKWVTALAGLKRMEEVAALLDATEKHFRDQKRWSERVAAKLGAVAASHRMPERAERWLEEAIRLRQEATGHRGGRDSTLSRYYRSLAKARGDLGKTVEAVQAASTAILSANVRNRREFQAAIKSLDDALASAKELEAYVETYEAEVGKTGLDAPVLRKALARAFAKRGNHAAAVHHLRTARELEPGDGDVHAALVAAYDKLGDAAGAIDALFGSIRLAPHALDAYQTLAARYAQAGDASAAERAHTTLVETTPHQQAGHRALAGVREGQGRWADAAVQWRQVVRTERLDPTGWLGLARVLIRTGDAAGARTTLEHVIKTKWESRFGDVKKQAADLLEGL